MPVRWTAIVAGAEVTLMNAGLRTYFPVDHGALVVNVLPRSPAAQAGGIDQDKFVVAQAFQRLRQADIAVRFVHGDTQLPAVAVQLFATADADGVGGDQRHVASAVAGGEPRGERLPEARAGRDQDLGAHLGRCHRRDPLLLQDAAADR